MKFSNILERILADPVKIRTYRILARHPGGLTGRGVGAMIQTSPFKINQVLRELVEEEILEMSVVGRAHLYRFHRGHILVDDLIQYVLNFEDRLFMDLGKKIASLLKPKPLSVILYGSVARGDEKAASDLDLYLIYPDEIENAGSGSETVRLLSEKVAGTYGNNISLRRARVSDFQRLSRERDPLTRKIVKEGKILAGLSMTELLDYGKAN